MTTTELIGDSKPRRRRRLLLLGLSVPLLVAGCLGWRAMQPLSERTFATQSALALDLTRPDALIESRALAQLPRDLLRIPLLRDTLTEDFVFYYEGNADRLGIAGALRRIVYEHQLSLRDDLLNSLLDQPAEIALWRSPDGKLGHALLLIERSAVGRTLQALAEVVASDTQLSKVGELHVEGWAAPVYRLRYNVDRSILLVAHEDRLLVLSSAEMLQADSAADSLLGEPETQQLEALLAKRSPYAARFGLNKRRPKQRLTFSAEYLALGYGQFIPQLAGFSFELRGSRWRAALALNPGPTKDLQFRPLWQAMPLGASACAAVPVSHDALQPLLERLGEHELLAPELAAQLNGPVALCWYGKSSLHSPLLVTQLSGDNPELDTQLGTVFEKMIGAYEEKADDGRFPVKQADLTDGSRWTRIVGSSFGLNAAAEFEDPESLSNDYYFNVALARHGNTLLFSLDDTLVEQAVATLDKRFPPLAEQLPKRGEVPLWLAPDSFATLIEGATLESLPADFESVFRNAAEAQLLPKLRALAGQQQYSLVLPDRTQVKHEWTWVPLRWAAR